jgi:hypothetical protein
MAHAFQATPSVARATRIRETFDWLFKLFAAAVKTSNIALVRAIISSKPIAVGFSHARLSAWSDLEQQYPVPRPQMIGVLYDFVFTVVDRAGSNNATDVDHAILLETVNALLQSTTVPLAALGQTNQGPRKSLLHLYKTQHFTEFRLVLELLKRLFAPVDWTDFSTKLLADVTAFAGKELLDEHVRWMT